MVVRFDECVAAIDFLSLFQETLENVNWYWKMKETPSNIIFKSAVNKTTLYIGILILQSYM